ncbi:MAG: nucleoside triphosphate pyrophosphohydrolase [Deltaproteobacteria bacterium]|nr:nucleoside triphosphate pyrophosphohydrolase [Deltaproteobacteria bacterium]
MERLRAPNGCPWDKEQTLESLIPFIIEEAYEVISAIDSKDPSHIKEELGDLLFQVIFASQITKEKNEFDIADVIDTSFTKMVRRHPHVFGDVKAETPEEVLKHWAEIKKEEKKEAGKKEEGYLSGIPEVLPALLRAHKVSQKAAKVGFDWKDVSEVLAKMEEEMNEFRQAVLAKNTEEMEEELGDFLFTVVNIGRFLEVNPENALRKTIGKFINRFHYIEKRLDEKGMDLSTTPIEEMERLWQESKVNEKR